MILVITAHTPPAVVHTFCVFVEYIHALGGTAKSCCKLCRARLYNFLNGHGIGGHGGFQVGKVWSTIYYALLHEMSHYHMM
jgi:hypothetical protein